MLFDGSYDIMTSLMKHMQVFFGVFFFFNLKLQIISCYNIIEILMNLINILFTMSRGIQLNLLST